MQISPCDPHLRLPNKRKRSHGRAAPRPAVGDHIAESQVKPGPPEPTRWDRCGFFAAGSCGRCNRGVCPAGAVEWQRRRATR